jgi:hypothetical protein
VAARSKAWVWGLSLAGIVGSDPAGLMDVCLVCYVLSGRGLCDGLITRPEESYRLCCVVVHDLETSRIRRPWPTGGCCDKYKKKISTTTIIVTIIIIIITKQSSSHAIYLPVLGFVLRL